MEEFRDVIGHEGMYQISNLGNVKSLARIDARGCHRRDKILKTQYVSTSGYLVANLYKNGKMKTRTIHQLVAEAFLNHTPNGKKANSTIVNHINFDRTDNRLDNLELTTMRKNTNQKHLKSSSDYTGVHWTKKKWRSKIVINGKQLHLGLYENEKEAGIKYFSALVMFNNGKDVEKIKSFIRYKD